MQASGEIYAAHSQRLPQAGAILMLDALADMAQHARDVDADLNMRRLLAAAQAESKARLQPDFAAAGVIPSMGHVAPLVTIEPYRLVSSLCSVAVLHVEEQEDTSLSSRLCGDHGCWHARHTHSACTTESVHSWRSSDEELACAQVPEGKALADPPLLRLEGEACHAYLSMLLHLNTAASEPLQEAADVEKRLMQLCIANLRCFQVHDPAPHSTPHASNKLDPLLTWCLTQHSALPPIFSEHYHHHPHHLICAAT